jgi:hypothetical protein
MLGRVLPLDQYVGIKSRASPAPLPLVDALQRMPARWRTEALQGTSPFTNESFVAARPVAAIIEKSS